MLEILFKILAVMTPFALALIGALLAYFNNIRLETKKAKLKRINDQLQLLYGPLYALSVASEAGFSEFMKHNAKGRRSFFDGEPRSKNDIKIWRRWMKMVFQPLNEKMETCIISNTHLIDGEFPREFLDLITHVHAYRPVIETWVDNIPESSPHAQAVTDNASVSNFPENFGSRVREDFIRISKHQQQLLK